MTEAIACLLDSKYCGVGSSSIPKVINTVSLILIRETDVCRNV